MSKRTRTVVATVAAALVLLGAGGYLYYRSLTAGSDDALQRQREGTLPTDGTAVHPSQQRK